MLSTNQITKVKKNLYFVHYGLILDFGGRTLFFGVIYILVLVSEILVEEIQNSREIYISTSNMKNLEKKIVWWKSLKFWFQNSISHTEHLFYLLIIFYFQVTLVT
jgi:hypothetical protein